MSECKYVRMQVCQNASMSKINKVACSLPANIGFFQRSMQVLDAVEEIAGALGGRGNAFHHDAFLNVDAMSFA